MSYDVTLTMVQRGESKVPSGIRNFWKKKNNYYYKLQSSGKVSLFVVFSNFEMVSIYSWGFAAQIKLATKLEYNGKYQLCILP